MAGAKYLTLLSTTFSGSKLDQKQSSQDSMLSDMGYQCCKCQLIPCATTLNASRCLIIRVPQIEFCLMSHFELLFMKGKISVSLSVYEHYIFLAPFAVKIVISLLDNAIH